MRLSDLSKLRHYHPVIIEGMGGYDTRHPERVASKITKQLSHHWQSRPAQKPKLIIIQGDPLETRGISAITPQIAKQLEVKRCLICLDEHLAAYHARDADRENVILEYRYSQLVDVLQAGKPATTEQTQKPIIENLEAAIATRIERCNQQRADLGKSPLKDYYPLFAQLQEVTKAACRALCGEITVAHTSADINAFSVTSFYTIGLELGLMDPQDMVRFD
ncbi:MAG: shikimate kinase [Spiribacter sp.]|nr:shikimate kinase [Spiribacter sp.]MDR9490125.1 shikimate kinase [Spiribacter sp.]